MRKRHGNKRDKERLEKLHFWDKSIITKYFLTEEYANDMLKEIYNTGHYEGFYDNYKINLPIGELSEVINQMRYKK